MADGRLHGLTRFNNRVIGSVHFFSLAVAGHLDNAPTLPSMAAAAAIP